MVRLVTMVARISCALAAALALATSGLASADAVKPADVTSAQAAELLKFFNQLADAVVQNASDCDAMGTHAGAVLDQHPDAIGKIQAYRATGKKAPADVEAKMMARVKEVAPAVMKCMSNAKVKTLVARVQAQVAPKPMPVAPVASPRAPAPAK